MTNTTELHAVIDKELKENAEKILEQLGVTPANAIRMFYSSIVRERRIPTELDLPAPGFLFEGNMTKEEIDRELQKGMDSIEAGNVYTIDEVDRMLAEEFGI